MSHEIQGRDIIALGWEPGPVIGRALKVAQAQLAAGETRDAVLARLTAVGTQPSAFKNDTKWGEVAQLLEQTQLEEAPIQLRETPAPLTIWGEELIDPQSFTQINQAASLPVTLRVALMPDAHVGYGLPIGGVAALDNAIAPYMVGVDIGCRMHATIYDRNPIHLDQDKRGYVSHLLNETYFGRSAPPQSKRNSHPILDDPRWELLPRPLRGLKDQAAVQLGTSGGGNHFVEWTKLKVLEENALELPLGKYIALVSHSGSRGVGFKIAQYYSRMAEDIRHTLPGELRKLAWLDYSAGEGQEYEMAMQLAGDFARANHEVIHARISAALGGQVVGQLQNHHNFAWRIERPDGPPVFVHRKGATPAEAGVLGIIPGSMATPGFFVQGLGYEPARILEHPALNSAAHGSGRVLGRRQAQRSLDHKAIRRRLEKQGITLIGGGLDEAPDAYKDSRQVIEAQADLVNVWAEFEPVIVRMEKPRGRSLGKI